MCAACSSVSQCVSSGVREIGRSGLGTLRNNSKIGEPCVDMCQRDAAPAVQCAMHTHPINCLYSPLKSSRISRSKRVPYPAASMRTVIWSKKVHEWCSVRKSDRQCECIGGRREQHAEMARCIVLLLYLTRSTHLHSCALCNQASTRCGHSWTGCGKIVNSVKSCRSQQADESVPNVTRAAGQ